MKKILIVLSISLFAFIETHVQVEYKIIQV